MLKKKWIFLVKSPLTYSRARRREIRSSQEVTGGVELVGGPAFSSAWCPACIRTLNFRESSFHSRGSGSLTAPAAVEKKTTASPHKIAPPFKKPSCSRF